jgi:hypothetical protein
VKKRRKNIPAQILMLADWKTGFTSKSMLHACLCQRLYGHADRCNVRKQIHDEFNDRCGSPFSWEEITAGKDLIERALEERTRCVIALHGRGYGGTIA